MAAAVDISEVHRFSLEEYHELIDSGALENAHVEFIQGLIVEMNPKSPEHENIARWLLERLARGLDWDRYQLGATGALTLEESGSEPEPDLMVIPRDAPRPYHPATASLVVEVSLSSLRRDLPRKRGLYALAGVLEYWVVDVGGGRVIVHCDPRGGDYEQVSEVGRGGVLTSAVLGAVTLSVDELLGAAG